MLYAAANDLPRTEEFIRDTDKDKSNRVIMEFRLVYKGALKSGNAKGGVPEKHRIRRDFHKQLTELWKKEKTLSRQINERFVTTQDYLSRYPISSPFSGSITSHQPQYMMLNDYQEGGRPYVEMIADDYSRCGFRFVPLIRLKNDFTCALDILFLRRGHPGDLIVSGDLDNRLKTLFDALKMPRECSEVRATPESDENPFFCLLEDDSLITSMAVTTDRLLSPKGEDEGQWDVELVIHVKVIDPGALLGTSHLI